MNKRLYKCGIDLPVRIASNSSFLEYDTGSPGTKNKTNFISS
jgi:hypothetical protein